MQQGLTKKQIEHIIPTNNEILEIGDDWFKDTITGICYRVVIESNILVVAETRKSHALKLRPIATVIKCMDCGEHRTIYTQDKHQTNKCRHCQYESRLQQRRNYLARKRKEKKDDPNYAKIKAEHKEKQAKNYDLWRKNKLG